MLGTDAHFAALGVLDGIRQQVGQDLPQLRDVRHDDDRRVGRYNGEGEAALAGQRLDVGRGDPQHIPDLGGLEHDLLPSGAEALQVEHLIDQPALLEKLDKSGLAAGVYTLNDILEELKKPGRDPRETFLAPSFQDNVKEIGDLQPGMTLEGVVTNVTKFGAFVDVGVHQDGLVHISELSDRYIKEPGDVVKTGQIVKVHVLSADPKTKRIALSMKTPGSKTAPPKPQHSMDDKVAALADRWKKR